MKNLNIKIQNLVTNFNFLILEFAPKDDPS